ncbi:MAG: FecR family protein [Bacteroidota bacterium]
MKFNKILIIKYISGNATLEEKECVLDWIEKSNHNKRLFLQFKNIWLEAKETDETYTNTTDAFHKFSNRIDARKQTRKFITNKRSGYVWLRYAANIIIIFALGLITYRIGLKGNTTNTNDTFNEIVVPYGGISSVNLPDGSKIWLHSGSTLKYRNTFGETNRDVYLDGEAYFNVGKNKNIPFVVNTSHITINVTGTSFNVKAYQEDDIIETTLEEGAINITNIRGRQIKEPIKLRPKDKFTLVKKTKNIALNSNLKKDTPAQREDVIEQKIGKIPGNAYIIPNVKVEENTGWKDGVYILHDKPLSDLAKTLERRYNVSIKFTDDTLKEYAYSGVLKDLTLEQVLEALKLTSKVDYHIDKRTVTLLYDDN